MKITNDRNGRFRSSRRFILDCSSNTESHSRVTEKAGVYGEGQFHLDKWFVYIVVVNNLSQFVAMYSLVMFYKAYRHYLAPMSPIGKFLCIKAVIFFSFL